MSESGQATDKANTDATRLPVLATSQAEAALRKALDQIGVELIRWQRILYRAWLRYESEKLAYRRKTARVRHARVRRMHTAYSRRKR